MATYIGNVPVPQASQTRDRFVATEGQTSFASSGYHVGFIDVYLNGVKLDTVDYTATNGSDVVLTVGATAGDILDVVAFTTFAIADDIDNTSVTTGALTVNGNITVTGTVDGRDVATDGTKLDGIEAGATGDQTASEILTAVKTVDGAASGLDADLLDGQHGSYYTGYTDTAIANLVDTAPSTLDTLNELAAALGDDPNFATTVSNQIGTKQDAATALTTTTTFGGDVSGTYNAIVVADDSHNHIIANVDGLQAALDGKVDDSQVLTNVPAGAVFTDTTYSVGNGGLTEINFTSALNSKLAGIEAGATGDQSAAEILAAIKTVDGAGSGLDADLLDGQSSAYYATATHNHTLDGLSNTTITSVASGEILKWNGTAWVNNTLAEAGIQPAGSYLTTSTTFSGDVSGTYNAIVVADDSHNHVISNVDGLQTALDGKSATSHNHTLDSLSNTTITSVASGEILKWNGSAWINNTLAEAGIQPAGSYLTGNQTITLTGDASGSGTTSIAVTVANDSHSHSTSTITGLGALATLSSVNAATIADNSVGAAELNVSGNGTSGYALTSDGDGSFSWTELSSGGGAASSTIQVFTASGTWTKPTGCTKVKVTVVGGGGGAGGVYGDYYANAVSGGGGAGGAAIEYIDVSAVSTVTVTVGGGGAGAGSTGNGGGGGTSSFGAYCSASGGGGGQAMYPASGRNAQAGFGGSGSGGTVNFGGGSGGGGGSSGTAGGGHGGNSIFGGGGRGFSGAYLHGNGDSGRAYGAGGGCAAVGSSGSYTGGSGAAGVVIVEEWY